jgi:hypothetical protein
MTNPDNHSSAGSAIAALAKRFWSIHPKEIQDLGITREQFYEREMLSLLAILVPTEPQTVQEPTRAQIAQAFETIRLKLVNCLEEPQRSAFWLAVQMRDALGMAEDL